MANPRIFEFRRYKDYLAAWLRAQPKRGRGMQSRLARAIGCQPAYVSQVLSGAPDLSLEQADRLSRHLGHTTEERRYLQLLVQRARAGTPSLREDLEEQLAQARERQLVLKDRLKIRSVREADQPRYFSSWHYAGVHVALTVPALRTRDAIAAYLGLPAARVAEVLDTLVSMGLARRERDGSYATGEARLHLGHDSPLIERHHSNWRLQAIRALDRRRAGDQHYSSVVTISREDALRIREDLVAAIEKVKKSVKDSPAEEIYCFSLDFFGMREER
jgi:uncharacterized protein (TIGR02147 family)